MTIPIQTLESNSLDEVLRADHSAHNACAGADLATDHNEVTASSSVKGELLVAAGRSPPRPQCRASGCSPPP